MNDIGDKMFRLLLDLFMVSDPWPLTEEEHESMKDGLDRQSRMRGFDDWVDAYHAFKVR